jgi:antitoxin CcdA
MRSVREASKRAVNLSLNSKVLELAKEMGMNISQTVDELLTEAVLKRYWAQWNVSNKAAIDHYNARIEREGTFAQRIQRHMSEKAAEAAEDKAQVR